MSECSGSPSDHHHDSQPPKRKAAQAGIDGNTTGRSVKRRASKACQCCRARKVRCNVTEHGAPCTNCRLDEVECIVSESRRKKSVSKVRYPTAPLGNSPSSREVHEISRNVVMRDRRWSAATDSAFIPSRQLPAPEPIYPAKSAIVIIASFADVFAGNGQRTKNTTRRARRIPFLAPTASSHRARPWTAFRT